MVENSPLQKRTSPNTPGVSLEVFFTDWKLLLYTTAQMSSSFKGNPKTIQQFLSLLNKYSVKKRVMYWIISKETQYFLPLAFQLSVYLLSHHTDDKINAATHIAVPRTNSTNYSNQALYS